MFVVFDLLDFLLYGSCLIEVSVGIGKMFIIVLLYVCLVFDYGGESVFGWLLSLLEIFVVIFIDVVI